MRDVVPLPFVSGAVVVQDEVLLLYELLYSVVFPRCPPVAVHGVVLMRCAMSNCCRSCCGKSLML